MKKELLVIVADYIRATENEISIDKSVYDLANTSPERLGYMPRPAKILNRFIKRPVLFKLLVMVLRGLWCTGGASLFFFYEMIVFYKYYRRVPPQLESENHSREYALAFSARAADILTSKVLSFEPECWITFPWVQTNFEREVESIDVFSLLKGKDIFAAFVLAVIASRKIARRKKNQKWTLQSYTAFRWFAVRIALGKLPVHKLIIAEHYDRWAMLADSMASRCGRDPGNQSDSGVELVMVQHGSLFGLASLEHQARPSLPFKLGHKLKNVTHAFVYNEDAQMIFASDILSFSCTAVGVSFTYFSPAIKLTTYPSENPVRVLFVGHPICEGLHVHLLRDLVQAYQVSFYYKPHPTAGAAESVQHEAWQVIVGRESFPEVDFLIAYPSTLVIEYAASGISAILHPLDLNSDVSSGLLESIKSKLDTMGCKK